MGTVRRPTEAAAFGRLNRDKAWMPRLRARSMQREYRRNGVKCLACGALVPKLLTVCPKCGSGILGGR